MKPTTYHLQTASDNSNVAMEYEAVLFAQSQENNNDIKHDVLKRVMRLVIENELTDVEKDSLTAYFYDNKPMHKIAEELGINKATVSKNISRGVNHVKRYLKYCDMALNIVPIDVEA